MRRHRGRRLSFAITNLAGTRERAGRRRALRARPRPLRRRDRVRARNDRADRDHAAHSFLKREEQ